MSLTEAPEHPTAKRMRLEFESEFGNMSDIMRAMNHWYNIRTDWNSPYNRSREKPITEDDVDLALKAVFSAVHRISPSNTIA